VFPTPLQGFPSRSPALISVEGAHASVQSRDEPESDFASVPGKKRLICRSSVHHSGTRPKNLLILLRDFSAPKSPRSRAKNSAALGLFAPRFLQLEMPAASKVLQAPPRPLFLVQASPYPVGSAINNRPTM
jgi:hypothetical protein